MSELADKLEKLRERRREPWYVQKEPHSYQDGTTHFTHVMHKVRDHKGTELTVVIAEYLTPALAELLVTLHNNLDEIVTALRK